MSGIERDALMQFHVGRKARSRTLVMAALRKIADYSFLYFFLLLFALMALAWSLTGSLLHLLLPRAARRRFGPALVTGFARCYINALSIAGKVRFDLADLDSLRREQAIIIAPNHPSMLDAVMIISRLPRIVCIAKAELWDNPLLGGGMKMAGYIRNDAAVKLTKLAVAKLQGGQQLLLFPEGTRTTRRPVNGFRGGFALTAKMAGVPVQTVIIEANTPFLGKGWPLFKLPDFPLVYRARLGRRFTVEGEVKPFIASLERYFREELAASGPRSLVLQ
jgi:1-acyl-sn-glycerol-3-phosphate acyltransferase